MRTIYVNLIVGFLAGSLLAQQAATEPPLAVRVVPNALAGPVDPYNPVTERNLFFQAAGTDSKLGAVESATAVGRTPSFARTTSGKPLNALTATTMISWTGLRPTPIVARYARPS